MNIMKIKNQVNQINSPIKMMNKESIIRWEVRWDFIEQKSK